MPILKEIWEMKNNKKPSDKTSSEVMSKPEVKEAKHAVRSLGNSRVAAEAQRIYNPSLPPTAPKGPTEAQTDLGVSAATGPEEGWGRHV